MESFVRLILSSEREVYRYIFALVPNHDDAQDIFQETSVALWRDFAKYDVSRPFVPWACRYAYYEVLNFRKRRPRHATQWLDEKVVELLADDCADQSAELNQRRTALSACIEKLPSAAKELLDRRYNLGQTVQQIGRDSGRSVNTLYKAMERIRRWLAACVDHGVAAAGSGV